MTAEQKETFDRILAPDRGPFTDWRERGALCVLTESTGHSRTTLLVREIVEPEREDFDLIDKFPGVELVFRPRYKRRARQRAKNYWGPAGLMYVHSHPETAQGAFSPGDREHDRAQLYEEVQKFERDDIPLAAAVVHDGDDPWCACRYDYQRPVTPSQRDSPEYGPESVEQTPVTAIRVVGEQFHKQPTLDGADHYGPRSGLGELNEAQQDSTLKLWGKRGQRRFGGLRVGIIGCGGGGSILAETLARLGVGELVLIDFDRIKGANANRHLGATQEDIDQQRDKVKVCAQVARNAATCPDFEVRSVVGSVFENGDDNIDGQDGDDWQDYDALKHVLDCDVVMNAADPSTVRCTVGRLAYAHLIPVVDAGSRLHHDDGVFTGKARSTVTVAGPGHPCLACAGQWNDMDYRKALIGKALDEYPDQDDGEPGEDQDDQESRQPSAMPFNLLTMGLACHRFIDLIQGLAPDGRVGKANLRLKSLSVDWAKQDRNSKLEVCRESCNRPEIATGDSADLKRGPDRYLRDERFPR